MQHRLTAAGQDKPPPPSGIVDDSLDVGKENRETLYLIQDAAVFQAAEESSWIGFGRGPDIRVFQ